MARVTGCLPAAAILGPAACGVPAQKHQAAEAPRQIAARLAEEKPVPQKQPAAR